MSTPTVNAGIIVSINNTDVTLMPSSLTDISSNGFSYSLDSEVDLGKLENLTSVINTTFGTSIALPTATGLPQPLKDIYSALTTTDLTIKEFSLSIPKVADADTSVAASSTFSLKMQLTLESPLTLGGVLSVKGAVIKVVKKS